jgi:hypothetical protein
MHGHCANMFGKVRDTVGLYQLAVMPV